jgi:carbonic anhydrase/acetyltransferase-like protein (isoleucine patch superfamily)
VLSGQVHLGAGSVVLDGAVVTAESAPVEIGSESIIMENAVIRGAGAHPAVIGDRTLIGPGAHVTGAVIGKCCMIATHSSVFNGATLADGVLVAIGAIVHVGTFLEEGARVPMQHIAVGNPAVIYPPERASEAHAAVEEIGFTQMVFGHDTSGMSFQETISWLCQTYAHSLRKNQVGEVTRT